LLAWRGDQLHSPGAVASPLSRQGAFLANNLLFCAFAFVVLLGTVFPLFVEALNGSSLTVGGPFFDTMTMPIVLCLLFLMAVAPVLPWRAASGDLLRQRLLWPAAAAAAVLLACVASGLRGVWPLLVFALGAFAGASALRQLVLILRRGGASGLVSRAGGGMIVHLGVVFIAVAFAASHAYEHEAQLTLQVGRPVSFEGHTLVLRGVKQVNSPGRGLLVVTVDLDGRAYYPAIEQFALSNDAVPSPAVRSTPAQDIYMDIATTPSAGNGPVALAVYEEPLVMWLWIGGFVVVAGAVVSMGPSGRRRLPPAPTAPSGPGMEENIALQDPQPAGSEVGAAV
jgi:cytochrome c-type biogenesis protein CcmF